MVLTAFFLRPRLPPNLKGGPPWGKHAPIGSRNSFSTPSSTMEMAGEGVRVLPLPLPISLASSGPPFSIDTQIQSEVGTFSSWLR